MDDESGPARETDAGRASAAFDAKLHAEDVTFDADDATLLRAIDETESLNAAADRLGRSFSRAHKRLSSLEAAFGALVESQRGGSGGGGSVLTGRGRRLLARFERVRREFSGVVEVEETVLDGRVVEYDGELATVETAAGRLRALAPPDASAVRVTIRADTVTLHDVEGAPPATETSARNRFEGTVVEVTDGESVRSVTLDVGTDCRLVALVTSQSSRELDLETGTVVLASFKTTATRATPRG
jgi:molybdate transport system regulatory protein